MIWIGSLGFSYFRALRDASGVVQEEEDETRSTDRTVDQRRLWEESTLNL